MTSWRMQFSGRLLKRGFWLYIWEIREEGKQHLYVGRTGDNSSFYASSPFRRIGQHLDTKLNAKGNALGKRLKAEGINPEACTFEMIAIGPIFEEQSSMPQHLPFRDKTAALERALASELKCRGYHVLGTHAGPDEPDAKLLAELLAEIDHAFPSRQTKETLHLKFQPIRAKGGASASAIVIAERRGLL